MPAESTQVAEGDKQASTSQSATSEVTPDATTQDKIAEKQESSAPGATSSNATSTFRALANAVSYAERIRASSPMVDNAVRKPVTPREEGSVNGKANTPASLDGKPTNNKRAGKIKSGSASNQKRPNEVTPTVPGSQGLEQPSGSAGAPEDDAEQGWQEVTAKSKAQQSNKGDKKDTGNSSANGRLRQHSKKPIINGTTADENTSHDRPAKGKSVGNSRKDQDKGEKEPRQQQSSSEDGVIAEPTRRQRQQQKEKDGSSPKSLGMKSASWRSSPLGSQPVSASAEDFPSSISAEPREIVIQPGTLITNPQETVVELKAEATESTGVSSSIAPTGGDAQSTRPSDSATVLPEVEKPVSTSTATPVNIWQLRKEKMKSTSTKQGKSGVASGKTVFSALSETTSSAQPTNNNSGKKNTGGARIEEAQSKKAPAAVSNSVNTQAASSTGKSASSKQATKPTITDAAGPSPGNRRDVASTTGAPNGNAKLSAGPSSRLADDQLWPDIAASAARLPGTTGTEGKKKEKDSEETLRPTTSNKKEKKKWTPIPPAEMQEALDKAEKARKAALLGGIEGAKQKRRNSTVAGADDTYQGVSKAGAKKNPQASAKAGGKTTTGAPTAIAAETSSKKAKATSSAAGKQANAVKSTQGIVPEENVPVGLGSGLVPAPSENSRNANGSRSLDRDIGLTQVPRGESGESSATNEREVQNEQAAPFPSLVAENGSPKRKVPVSERQKGQPGSAAGRPGPSTPATNNHHVQMRDVTRGGIAAGRGGRGHGGKTARGAPNSSGLKYSDNGMATSPRGQSKPALLSPPHGGYNGLPFESSMAAAVHAPGFVPYGTQPPYPFYPQGYYYGANTSGAGVSSSGSDTGGYDSAANAQQGGQQAFTPYNMAYVPQQRPVTEIPGLDTLRYSILGQIEYYFSITNLCMDQFLRGQMDAHGWVDIPMIASFNRIRQVTTDEDVVQEVAQLSHLMEVREKKMRLRDNWQMWVFPNAKPSIFPEAENTAATRMEELALHGVMISDLSEETRERIVGDIERDILRSTSGLASMPPALATEAAIQSAPSDTKNSEEVTAKSSPTPSPAPSVASDSSSDKLDIIV